MVVAPKVSGRIEQLDVDLADTVSRGQLVATLDNAEYVQALRQAQADLAVAKANLAEAGSLLTIAERELQRVDKLRDRGVSSESQRDAAMADQLAKKAHVEVTRAQVTRVQAELETTRIRLGYTQVAAGWRGGSEQRLVAERYVDEGEVVAANAPLLRIVELNPIKVVTFVTERDYALLKNGQNASLTTDAYPDESFAAEIVRISPVFREATRQAQVELRVDNAQLRLKPGMFVRVMVILEQAQGVTIVPEQALVTREGQSGMFVAQPAPRCRRAGLDSAPGGPRRERIRGPGKRLSRSVGPGAWLALGHGGHGPGTVRCQPAPAATDRDRVPPAQR